MSGIILPSNTPGRDMDDKAKTQRHSHLGVKGDLTVELHYGDFDDSRGRQAALYLWRRGRESQGIFVPLATMWMYGHTTLDQAKAFEQLIPSLADHLYHGVVTKSDMVRVMDSILDYLGELRRSPPPPYMRKDRSLEEFLAGCEEEGLEFQIKVDGKRVLN